MDENDKVLKYTTMAHSDSGLLTLLSTFNFIGLQVLINGEFRNIKPQPNTVIVNLGKFMPIFIESNKLIFYISRKLFNKKVIFVMQSV